MARPKVYQPAISPSLISALFHEAKHRRIPMTKLINRLLKNSLQGTDGYQKAAHDWPELTAEIKQGQRSC